jgi:hypothetical protein
MNTKEIILYQTQGNDIAIDVLVENENIWLTQAQIATLFGTKRQAITKHLSNIFKENELDKNSVSSILELTATDGKSYQTNFYSLDAILSVGYRVNSKNATQFRIWANKVLKDYIIKGYAVNDKLKLEQYNDLKQTIKLLSNVVKNKELTADEQQGLLQVITDYTYALDTLDRYDYQSLAINETTDEGTFRATYETAMSLYCRLNYDFQMIYMMNLILIIAITKITLESQFRQYDCRKPYRRKRCDSESSREFDK